MRAGSPTLVMGTAPRTPQWGPLPLPDPSEPRPYIAAGDLGAQAQQRTLSELHSGAAPPMHPRDGYSRLE